MNYKELFEQIGKIYHNLTLRQKIVAASAIVLVVGFLVFLTLYKSGDADNQYAGYSVLFRNVDPAVSQQIITQLEADGVKYQLADEGTILVPTESVYKERISVASLGIMSEGKAGFEIFDKQDFGATENEQRVKFQRAIQGELSKTIEGLEPIEQATVYVAFPKDSVFTERQTPPTASVVVRLVKNAKLSRRQIEGIKRIVSGSVPNLTLENVKIVTADGVAIGDDEIAIENELIAAQLKYKKDYENSSEQKIIDILSSVLGDNKKVSAKVSVEFDFSTKDSQQEIYDPNSVIRSQQNIEEKREGREPKDIGGVPGAISNIGPAEGLQDNKPSESYQKNVENTNYEISKQVIKTKNQYATIKRITAAVAVDGRYETRADANDALNDQVVYIPLSAEEIASIQSLVEQSIGYDPQRGDSVTVSNFAFQQISEEVKLTAAQTIYNSYIKPVIPVFKYLIVLLILYVFYKKVITPFLERMVADFREEENVDPSLGDIDMAEDAEDALEKFKAARKRVENELGLNEAFNEDELKYEVLIEKMRLIASERTEEFAQLLQNMVKADAEFAAKKDL